MRKKITYTEYEAKMNKVIRKNKDRPVHESLIEMLEVAGEYDIKGLKKRRAK